MSVHATIRIDGGLRDGESVRLCAGDTLGRLIGADLHLDDPSISELHAYATVRDGALVLLPLRGALRVFGVEVRQVALEAGQVIALAEGIGLTVIDVFSPRRAEALRVNDALVPLTNRSFGLRATGEVVSARHPEATVVVWCTSDAWRLRAGDTVHVLEEAPLELDGLRLSLETTRLDALSVDGTQATGWHGPLRMEAQFDSVILHRADAPPLRITGFAARVLTFLAEVGGPVRWEVAASDTWRGVTDRGQLRRKWDRALLTVRGKCRDAGFRADLVTSSGGLVELSLRPEDELVLRG